MSDALEYGHYGEPWQREPKDYMEMVYGPEYFVNDTEVIHDLGAQFWMYVMELYFPAEEFDGLEEPRRYP